MDLGGLSQIVRMQFSKEKRKGPDIHVTWPSLVFSESDSTFLKLTADAMSSSRTILSTNTQSKQFTI